MLNAVISSGIFRGKKLTLPSLATTRSTKNLVKGSFFDTIRFKLSGRVFIECFGGSGVMALEALSNGAKAVIAIEKDKKAYEILKQNFIKITGADFGENRAILGDCFEKLPQCLLKSKDEIILYFDPPFEIRRGFDGIYDKILTLMADVSEFKNVKMICIEHMSKIKIPSEIADFECIKMRKFGATSLSYLERK